MIMFFLLLNFRRKPRHTFLRTCTCVGDFDCASKLAELLEKDGPVEDRGKCKKDTIG